MITKNKKRYLLGLTGSIGMGKSTTAVIFAQMGIPVWDADATVHRLYQKNGKAVGPVGMLVPGSVQDNTVNREVLRNWIADTPDGLQKLERIVHPMVANDRQDFIRSNQATILLFDIPLLFETRADAWLDGVAVVTTNPETQKARVLERPGMTEERFELIKSKQMSDSEKRTKADFIIPSHTLESARTAVETVLRTIRENNHA